MKPSVIPRERWMNSARGARTGIGTDFTLSTAPRLFFEGLLVLAGDLGFGLYRPGPGTSGFVRGGVTGAVGLSTSGGGALAGLYGGIGALFPVSGVTGVRFDVTPRVYFREGVGDLLYSIEFGVVRLPTGSSGSGGSS